MGHTATTGSTKPIEDITLGDEVTATDPTTGDTRSEKVTHLYINVDHDLTNVTVSDDTTGEVSVLNTTQHHPFWDATDRQWVDAGELDPGHRLFVHDDKRLEGDSTGAGAGGGGPGTQVTVITVDNFDDNQIMRDLTVADIHTYYVLAGNTPVLVHNCPPGGGTVPSGQQGRGLQIPDGVSKGQWLKDRAGTLGFSQRIPAQKVPFDSKGQAAFFDGKRYITPDITGHNTLNGWKMFDRKGNRLGTYDSDLNYLKD